MRLLCDAMLGKLARWLRLLGHDTAYRQDVDDDALLGQAEAEDRVLLTRDVALAARAPAGKAFLVRSLDPAEQLREAVQGLGLRPSPDAAMTRCTLCNAVLREAPREEAAGHVPQGAFEAQERFWRCPDCGQFYWRGTHAERIGEALRGLGAEHVP